MLKWVIPRLAEGAVDTDPGLVTRAREAIGWTQEQAADALGVLPVEVATWESGAIPLSRYEAEMVRWRMADADYQQRLADASVACPWLSGHRPPLAELENRGPKWAAWVARSRAAHRAACDVCAQASRDVPGPPEKPVAPGFRGRVGAAVSRLPKWLRLPLNALYEGLPMGVSAVVVFGVSNWLTPPGGDLRLSPSLFLWVTLGWSWLVLTCELLRPVGDRRPYLGGQLWAAALGVPPLLVLPAHPALWVFAAIMIALVGLVLGAWYDPDANLS